MLYNILQYLQYYLRAQTKYRVHSPSLYRFVEETIEDKRNYYSFGKIEGIRSKMMQDHRKITIEDLGAGSSYGDGAERKISKIAKTAVSKYSKCKLLYRITKFYKPDGILELGTSLGISTSYLANLAPTTTIEGSKKIADVASKNFNDLDLDVDLRVGNIDNVLNQLIHEGKQFQLVVVDGNHRKEPTLAYFEQLFYLIKSPAVIIFDDIYWSKEMTEAWEIIKSDKRVSRSIDLFTFGIVEIGIPGQGGHHTLISSKLKPFQFGFFSTGKAKSIR